MGWSFSRIRWQVGLFKERCDYSGGLYELRGDTPGFILESISGATQGFFVHDVIEEAPSCPICSSASRSILYSDLTDDLFGAPGNWNLWRCRGCSSAWLDPRPTKESMGIYYQRYYTHEEGANRNDTSRLSRLRLIRRAVVNSYLNNRFGTQFRPATRVAAVLALVFRMYKNSLDSQLRHLPKLTYSGRVLDVGAGNGDFLIHAQSAGWNVAGVEPDGAAAAIARNRGLEVYEGDVFSVSDGDNNFDAVTLSHVIEHVHDPVAVLEKSYMLLKPGGMIYIETPNISSPGHARFGRFWRGLEPPRHLVIFSWDSLETTLLSIGFVGIKRRPRTGIYAPIAKQSRLLRGGVRVDTQTISYAIDCFREIFFSPGYRNKEFITLTAIKPREGNHGSRSRYPSRDKV